MIKVRCQKKVWTGNRPTGLTSHQCTRYAVKDGYCKIHHPDAIKVREQKAAKKLEATPFSMIHKY